MPMFRGSLSREMIRSNIGPSPEGREEADKKNIEAPLAKVADDSQFTSRGCGRPMKRRPSGEQCRLE